jgi:hypothetical protein
MKTHGGKSNRPDEQLSLTPVYVEILLEFVEYQKVMLHSSLTCFAAERE